MKKTNFSIDWNAILLSVLLVFLALFSMRINSKPMGLGIVLAYVSISIIALNCGSIIGALSGLMISSIGFYLRFNHFKIPNLSPEKIPAYVEKMNAFNASIKPYLILLIITAILIGYLFGKLKNKQYTKILKVKGAPIFFVLIFSSMAIFLSYSAVQKEMLIPSFILVYLIISLGALIYGKYLGLISGIITVALSIYLKIYHYNLPSIPKDIDKAVFMDSYMEYLGPWISILSKFFILFIALGGLIGYFSGYLSSSLSTHIKRESKSFNTKKVAYASVFIALSVAINSLRIGSISFGGFPMIYAGLTMGPITGFIVGALSDVVGFIVRPSSKFAYNPLFTLTSALTGAIPVIIVHLLKDRYPNYRPWKVFIGIFTGQFITSLILVPLFVQILFTVPFALSFTKALANQSVSIPLYTFLFSTVHQTMSKQINLNVKQ